MHLVSGSKKSTHHNITSEFQQPVSIAKSLKINENNVTQVDWLTDGLHDIAPL